MPQTKPIVSVVNVVASASVDQKMDLNEITKTFPDVEYHPDVFPGLVYRLKTPKSATLIFSSGKMVCTGAKSQELAETAVSNVVKILRKGKIKIKNHSIIGRKLHTVVEWTNIYITQQQNLECGSRLLANVDATL